MIRIACRQSELAQVQARIIGDQLLEFYPGYELVTCSTLADRKDKELLANIGGKGLFVKEVEQALLEDRADIAVHSLKDMPVDQPEQLPIIAIGVRAPVNDVLIGASSWQELYTNSYVGTCSPRRAFQIKLLRPDLNVIPIRGNINTRISKLNSSDFDAIILAEAGIVRAGKNIDYYRFSLDEMLPAAGQGCLAVQKRPGFEMLLAAKQKINDPIAFLESKAERSIVKYLGANCHSPLAVLAVESPDRCCLQVRAGSVDGQESCALDVIGPNFTEVIKQMQSKIDKSVIREIISGC